MRDPKPRARTTALWSGGRVTPEPRDEIREAGAGRDEDREPSDAEASLAVEEAARAEEGGVDDETAEHPAQQVLRQAVRRGADAGLRADRAPPGPGRPNEPVKAHE